jgi:hypothetical protein
MQHVYAFDQNVEGFKRKLLEDFSVLPPCFMTSASKGTGRGTLLNVIAQLRAAKVSKLKVLALQGKAVLVKYPAHKRPVQSF